METGRTKLFAGSPCVDKVRSPTVAGHSLHSGLSARHPASQVFATGVASARQTMLSCRKRRRANLSPKLFHLTKHNGFFSFFLPHFLGVHSGEWLLLPKRASALWEGPNAVEGGTGKAEDASYRTQELARSSAQENEWQKKRGPTGLIESVDKGR